MPAARARERVHVDEEGKRAVTEFAMIEQAGKKAAWLALMPVTGRTHQLRAHCVALGTPILGDGKYAGGAAFVSREDSLPQQLHLHARRSRIPHPTKQGLDRRDRAAAGAYAQDLELLRLRGQARARSLSPDLDV